jgi:iron complex outermembrane receptor protein
MPSRFRCRFLSANAAVALALLAAPARTTAQSGGTLRGLTVEEGSGSPVAAALVVARSELGTVVRTVTSDDAGRFEFTALPPARYTVEASRFGYAAAALSGIDIRPGQSADVQLRLSVVALQADELIVAGTRRVERIADSDASVAVVQGERLRHRREPTLFGALRTVKGLDFFESGLGQQQVNARGFVNPFTSNMLFLIDHRLSTLPGLGTVLPGVVPTSQEDIAQIEVVTGPTSALYGPNAGNGVVNVVTRDPRDGGGHSIGITGGERNLLRLVARTSGLLGQKFGYKLAGETYRADDFERINTFNGTGGFSISDQPDFTVRNRALNGALYWYPAASSRIVYSGGFTRSNYINLTVVSRLQVREWDAWYHQLRGHFDDVFGLGSLFVQGYVTENDAGDSYYLDILVRNQIPRQNGGAGLTPEQARQRALFVDRSDRTDLEIQHSKSIGGGHFLTSGVQWRRISPRSEGTYLTDGPLGEPIRIDEWGSYIGYENRSLPTLRLSLVGRYDNHSDFGSHFSPKLAVAWTASDGHALRASYNRAFNSPTTYLLYAQSFTGRTTDGLNIMVRGNRAGFSFVNELGGAVPEPLPALEALSIQSFEAGYRGVFAGRVFLDAALYRSTYENYISKETAISRPADGVFAIDPRTGQTLRELTRTYLNYGELPTWGADLGAQWLPTDHVSLSANFSYQEPGDFNSPLPGLEPPSFNAPERKYKLGAAWRGWWKPGTWFDFSASIVDDYFFLSSLPYLTGTVPDYAIADFNAGIPITVPRAREAHLAVAIKNLFDSHHFEVPGGARLGRVATVTVSATW